MKIFSSLVMVMLLGVPVLSQAPYLIPSRRQVTSSGQSSLSTAEVAELINETCMRSWAMTGRVFDYTYTVESVERELDRGSIRREHVKVYEAYPVRRSRARRRTSVLVQLSENGVPRSAEQIGRDRRRAARDITEAEERAANILNRPTPVSNEQLPNQNSCAFRISPERGGLLGRGFNVWWTDFLAAYDFSAPRRTLFNDRESIVLSFRPRSDLVAGSSTTRVLSRLGGRIWIDAVDRIIIRIEALPLQEVRGNKATMTLAALPDSNAAVAFEWTRLPNGTWLQSLFLLNTYGSEEIFEGVEVNRTSRFRDFRLFSAHVERERLDPAQGRP